MAIVTIILLVMSVACCGVAILALHAGRIRFRGAEHVRGRDHTYWIVVLVWLWVGVAAAVAAMRSLFA